MAAKHESPVTWAESVAGCVSLGGHLASIKTQEDFDDAMEVTGGQRFRIGLNDIAKEGEYRWVEDNSLASDILWKSGQPTNAGGIEHCSEIVGDGLNDMQCSGYRGIYEYLCQLRLT